MSTKARSVDRHELHTILLVTLLRAGFLALMTAYELPIAKLIATFTFDIRRAAEFVQVAASRDRLHYISPN